MKFAVVGGDKRQILLVHSMRKDGHEVIDMTAGGFEMIPDLKADAVILPLPAFRDGELNATFSLEKPKRETLLSDIPEGIPVLGGQIDDSRVIDYYKDEKLLLENAQITAECTVELLEKQMKKPLAGQKILVVGCGRIGKYLIGLLLSENAEVTAAARKADDKTYIESAGAKYRYTYELGDVRGFDLIINTVPAQIIGKEIIEKTKRNCVFVELASAPYGIDMKYAEYKKRPVVFAPGLPGKMAPEKAAEALKKTIYKILEVKNEQN